MFVLSSAFPIVAGALNMDRPPSWLGIADVATAAILFGVAAILATRSRTVVADRHRIVALRIGQIVATIIPVLLAAYFILGARINWTVLVIGLAWRVWLLFYSLPFIIAALDARSHDTGR